MFPSDATNFSQIFSGSMLWVYLGMSLVNAVILFFCSTKFMLVLQQGGYYWKRYFKWLKNRETPYMSRLMLLCLCSFLFFCVLSMCFVGVLGETLASFIGFIAYILFTFVYINSEAHVNAKLPLKKTPKLIRLCITYFIVLVGVNFGLIILLNYVAFLIHDQVVSILRFSLICILPILLPYIFFGAFGLNEPMEVSIRTHFIKRATAKIKQSKVLKIGITGSYGKTSVKEVLKTILSQKYRVLATPESYNTPLGIALTVNKLDSTHDILIAEMGARNKGNIKELADIVKPDYGILTGVNEQHLESFGSIEIIKDTKFELFEALGEKGVAFYSSDNENAVELGERFNGEKVGAGVSGSNNLVTASNVVTDKNGTTFTLTFNGETEAQCTTVLLGTHSISNICLAAAVAYKIGMSVEDIVQGINRIKSINHRLELLPNNKNIVIIDDSYNSNENGVQAAMDVMELFEGRKIVVTPGLVELGTKEALANFNFGKLLAKHADLVIVVGKHNAVMLIDGLIEGGMARENIRFAKNLNKGNEELNGIMREGDVVLFENDLPDNYN